MMTSTYKDSQLFTSKNDSSLVKRIYSKSQFVGFCCCIKFLYNAWNTPGGTIPSHLKRQFSSPSTTHPCQVLHISVNIMSTIPIKWWSMMMMKMLLILIVKRIAIVLLNHLLSFSSDWCWSLPMLRRLKRKDSLQKFIRGKEDCTLRHVHYQSWSQAPSIIQTGQ